MQVEEHKQVPRLHLQLEVVVDLVDYLEVGVAERVGRQVQV